MAKEIAQRDPNRVTSIQGVSSVDDLSVITARMNPTTKRLLVDATGGFNAGTDFDYLGIALTDTNEDTLTYYLGGSGGTLVRTMVIAYAAGAEKVSDSLTSLTFS